MSSSPHRPTCVVESMTPGRECQRCPRLVAFRDGNRGAYPGWHNAPVPSFGDRDAWLLVVGLAPGLRGANRTGRPFTGDFAGALLYSTLLHFGLAEGRYDACVDDGLTLKGCRITNAVRCVPPGNKPTPHETAQCRFFLAAEITALPHLRAIVALGTVAHDTILAALGARKAAAPFRHGARHVLSGDLILADSYHCSRLNTNTGRLTEAMFHDVFAGLPNSSSRQP
ncbi:MAG: uracil-DNA glycosylase [Alphaproteobacteria bacterium]|nr:uracil-DNA glycosylase [Alphaproteobacteria bacterium]